MTSTAGYRILDEIEPVSQAAWAMHPELGFYGSMLLDTPYLALICAVNSYLLGHPRRKHHVAVGVAAVMTVYAIQFVGVTFFPKLAWKYFYLAAAGFHMWLGYYFNEEHTWATEMFEHAGGQVLSFWSTIAVLNALGRMLMLRLSVAWMRLFVRLVP